MLRLFTMTAILAVGPMAAPPVFAQTTPPGHTAASSAKEALDQQDKNFIKEASIGGMAEVELSKMAQKSENADVKRFAARMIEDHSKANEQMATVAAALGIEPPKALDFRARAAAREAPDVARQGLRRSVYAGYGRGPRQGGEALRGGGTLRWQHRAKAICPEHFANRGRAPEDGVGVVPQALADRRAVTATQRRLGINWRGLGREFSRKLGGFGRGKPRNPSVTARAARMLASDAVDRAHGILLRYR